MIHVQNPGDIYHDHKFTVERLNSQNTYNRYTCECGRVVIVDSSD
jgi:hypothetical protein